jgi:serine/threonine protein kinase
MTGAGDEFAIIDGAFKRALAADPADRDAVIADACAGDERLIAEVRALLGADAAASRTTAGLSLSGDLGDLTPPPPGPAAPERIGAYTLGAVLGRGGMGVVYRAERTNPRRTVALKLIRRAVQGDNALRRFRLEAEALARLSHPGIAALYEIGLDQAGGQGDEQPFFAMELVEGVPVTEFADTRELPPRDRLALLAKVCDAIDHAHTRGVVHRDLKPENIFVTAEGEPKVLDLGIAKMANMEDTGVTAPTQAGQVIGTIHYMSPEQVSGDPDAIDPRCDVYALGVVGYELLTGELPIETTGVSMFEAMQRIKTVAPTPVRTNAPHLDPDIGTILAKAMAKDADGRYASASALAADLRRFLADEPILARPPSTWYHLTKFTKRNRALVGALAAVFVVLAGSLAAVGAALRTAERQRSIAEGEREILAQVNTFLVDDLIAKADPRQGGSKDVSLIDALNAAADSIGERFADAPAAEAAIRDSLGQIYSTLNDFERADANSTRAVELTPDSDAASRVDRLLNLALLALDLGEFDRAEALLTPAQRLVDEELSGDTERRLDVLSMRARLAYKRDDREAALAMYERVAEIGRRELPDDALTVTAIGAVGLIYQQLGRLDEALPLQLEAVRIDSERFGPEHPDTLTTKTNHAMLLQRLDRAEEAEALLQEILAIRLRTMGTENVDTNVTRMVYASMLNQAGRTGEAHAMATEALGYLEAALGADHRYTQNARRLVEKSKPEP